MPEGGGEVTADAARRFLVARHSLAPARSLSGGIDAVRGFFARFGSLQFDPIAVAGRSHDLVLHARVADYDPAWCETLYEGREIFEAVNKGLSFVATSEYPWFRAPSSRHARRILDENPEVAEHVLERIRAEGPLSSLDFERRRGAETDWFGAPTNVVRAVLEAYTDTGILGLARREGSRRYYDLLERLVPATVLRSEIPFAEQLRHKMHSRYRAHGLLGATSGGDVFGGLGPAKPRADRPAYPGRTALREQLIESGALVAVDVEGVRGTRYVLEDEVRLLEDPPEPTPSVGFLSPFDPLVWDRKLLASLFGFDYVWDLFHPPAKRRFGWYVLPILFGTRFVGRFEPRIDRDGERVEVLGLWWEHGFSARRADGFVEAMREALAAYLRFRDEPPRLAGAPGRGEAASLHARARLASGDFLAGGLESRGGDRFDAQRPEREQPLERKVDRRNLGAQLDAHPRRAWSAWPPPSTSPCHRRSRRRTRSRRGGRAASTLQYGISSEEGGEEALDLGREGGSVNVGSPAGTT